MGRGVGSIPSQWRLMPTWAEKGTVPSLVEETCPQMLVTEEAFCYSCKRKVKKLVCFWSLAYFDIYLIRITQYMQFIADITPTKAISSL